MWYALQDHMDCDPINRWFLLFLDQTSCYIVTELFLMLPLSMELFACQAQNRMNTKHFMTSTNMTQSTHYHSSNPNWKHTYSI